MVLIHNKIYFQYTKISVILSKSDNIESDIKNIFFNLFPNLTENDFDWKKKQTDYEDWDSFAQMQLITAVESKFSIEFDIDDVISITSADDLLNYVKKHV